MMGIMHMGSCSLVVQPTAIPLLDDTLFLNISSYQAS